MAQTSPAPMAFEIEKAEGAYLFDKDSRRFIDLVGGISVANTGHRHPKVIQAIEDQLKNYLHVMVYGEFVENPQVQYAKLLVDHLPSSLNSVYFTNSGAEAVEGAMKLAKRTTGRSAIIAFNNSYHGSTQGALSLIGDEYWRTAFRPLLPGITHLDYNSSESLLFITEETACVVLETVQAEAGIVVPGKDWIQALRKKCSETGTLLILDEIQAGFGRTGKLWGFEHFDIIPDILLLGKALGGGMPLGAFIADINIMNNLTDNPVLGHITTFGGHPVCCAAGKAAMEVLLNENLVSQVKQKEELFRSLLVHPSIKNIRSFGLWMAIEFDCFETNKMVIDGCLDPSGRSRGFASGYPSDHSRSSASGERSDGVMTDWFLFAPNCLRISPPLMIDETTCRKAAAIILDSIK